MLPFQSKRFVRLLVGCATILLMLSCTGCVRETNRGDSTQFTYELWVPGLILLGGIAAIPVGFLLTKVAAFGEYASCGWGLALAAPLGALVLTPLTYFERTTADKESFSIAGIWENHHVPYANLRQVTYATEVVRGRRGRTSTKHYFYCDCKDGSNLRIPLNAVTTQAALPAIVDRLEELKIPISDTSGAE